MEEFHSPSYDRDGVPLMLDWTAQDVGDWVRIKLNLPQYEDCFVSNFINGRRLVLIDASHLQRLGVKDFQHIQIISKAIRNLLGIEEPYWNRSIVLPPRDPVSHFLERKAVSGEEADALTFDQHIRDLQRFDKHWD